MKSAAIILAALLSGGVLTTGLAMAQSAPPERGVAATAGPAGETRGTVNASGSVLAQETGVNTAPAGTEPARTRIAQAGLGDPIPGKDVGLEHDPQGIVGMRTTDRQGNVVFADLAAGRYVVFMNGYDGNPVSIRISADAAPAGGQTVTIHPGRGRVYALDDKGQRLVVTIPRAGGRIGVNVSSIFDRWGRGAQTPR